MDYTPRFEQPVSLAQLRAIREPELLVNEIARLENSIQHLERSNRELRAFLEPASSGQGASPAVGADEEDDELDEETKAEFTASVKENEETIARQQERITMIRLALEEQVGVDAANPHYGLAGSTTAPTPAPAAPAPPTSAAPAVNGAEEGEVTGVTSSSARRAEPDADDGMYL
ncbi:hypothetical protein Rhopal_005870-T1 [Rhodotorula paludigena]|uniref:Uncharacterized protein n=1 Tax=Rhodotorula paludigena TaxID=86838 RepID=A0AAV5GTY4_9BASI|nr:hypothetical protein Rhopal_005870-T1 [Rhodotorula paludigena]